MRWPSHMFMDQIAFFVYLTVGDSYTSACPFGDYNTGAANMSARYFLYDSVS